MAKLFVSSTTGMKVGDTIEIMLDSGVFFTTKIISIPAAGQLVINPVLPGPATAGNSVVDLSESTNVAPVTSSDIT